MWFASIKRFFDNGHSAYTPENLKTFIVAKMITPQQYQQITDIEYAE